MAYKSYGIYDCDERSSRKKLKSGIDTRVWLWKTRTTPGDVDWPNDHGTTAKAVDGSMTINDGYLSDYCITGEVANWMWGQEDQMSDVFTAQLIPTETLNGGKITYYICNDGTTWNRVTKIGTSREKYDAVIHLPNGKLDKQQRYNQLKVKAVLERTTVSDTSPVLHSLLVIFR